MQSMNSIYVSALEPRNKPICPPISAEMKREVFFIFAKFINLKYAQLPYKMSYSYRNGNYHSLELATSRKTITSLKRTLQLYCVITHMSRQNCTNPDISLFLIQIEDVSAKPTKWCMLRLLNHHT